MANSKICMQSKSEDFGNPEELRGILQEIKSGTITLLNDPNNPHIYQLEFTDDCLQIEEDDFFKFVEQATELSTESTKIQYVFLTKLSQGVMYNNGQPIEVDLNNLEKPIHIDLSKYRQRGIEITPTIAFHPDDNVLIRIEANNKSVDIAFKIQFDNSGDINLFWNHELNKAIDINNLNDAIVEYGNWQHHTGPWLIGNTLVCGEVENDELTGGRLKFNLHISA